MENKQENSNNTLKEVLYQPLSVNLEDKLEKTKKESLFLYFSLLTVNLVLLTSGADFMWTSPVLPILQQNNTLLNPLGRPITAVEESLIAGLLACGSLIGSALASKAPDTYGRRNVLIFISLTKLCSHILLAFAKTVYLYCSMRFVLGMTLGMAISVIPTFVAEYTQDFNRGKFGSYIGLFVTLGNLYGFLIGSIFSTKIFTLLCGAPLIFNIICLLFFIPETPTYLLSQNKRKKATQTLEKILHNDSVAIKYELEKLESVLKVSSAEENSSFAPLLYTKGLRNGLVVSVGVNSFQQLTGISAIVGFIAPVFNSAGCSRTGNMPGIIIGFVQVTAYILASTVVDKLGRRILLLLSIIMCGIMLLLLGLTFYMINLGVYADILSWISVTCLIIFFVSFSLGLGPVPLIVMSEIFPNDVKVCAASITTFSSALCVFFAIFSFPLILQFMGVVWCFWLFSFLCLLGAVFIYFCVPETKGKSVAEIQKILSN